MIFIMVLKKSLSFQVAKMSKHKILNNMVETETLLGLVGS